MSAHLELKPGGPETGSSTWEIVTGVGRAFFPWVAVGVLAFLCYLFFRKWWREIDEESQRARGEILVTGSVDRRPLVALILVALILTMQEYYGGRLFYDASIRPLLVKRELAAPAGQSALKLFKYDELYGFAWWAMTRIVGYLLPLAVWKIFFRKDSILDMGFRIKGLWRHLWVYGVLLLIVLGPQIIVSFQPDFQNYYPFYKQATRSWWDFLCWEAMYFGQFFALEVFFRGWWLGALRKSFGSAAIFVMCVPYCMIHYGKPYFEANGAVLAGLVLGTLAMRTRSIYGGVALHVTVALVMDWLCLLHRHALPKTFWPP